MTKRRFSKSLHIHTISTFILFFQEVLKLTEVRCGSCCYIGGGGASAPALAAFSALVRNQLRRRCWRLLSSLVAPPKPRRKWWKFEKNQLHWNTSRGPGCQHQLKTFQSPKPNIQSPTSQSPTSQSTTSQKSQRLSFDMIYQSESWDFSRADVVSAYFSTVDRLNWLVADIWLLLSTVWFLLQSILFCSFLILWTMNLIYLWKSPSENAVPKGKPIGTLEYWHYKHP